MSAVAFAIFAVLATSLDGIVWKYTIDKKGCPWAALILFHLVSVVLLIPFTSLNDLIIENQEIASILLLSSIFWVIGDLFSTKAYKYLDAAVCQLYGSLKLVFVTLAGVILFAEHLSIMTIVGIALIISSIVFQMEIKNIKWNKGTTYSLIAIVFHTIALIIDKHLTSIASEATIVFYAFLVPGIIYSIAGKKYISNIPELLINTHYKFLVTPVLGTAAYYFLIMALSKGNLSTTYIIQETGLILVLILEILILRAYDNLVRKAIACSACALGAIMVCGVT